MNGFYAPFYKFQKMKKNISVQEIEEIIKNKLRQNGVLDMVGQEKVSEIKNKIKDILEKRLSRHYKKKPCQNS